MWVEMKVRGLALDPVSNMPIIILRDEEEKRSLPIWVGIFEANAIALELEKISTPRPMTHDLMKNIVESVEAKVEKIVINDLRDNTFFALIHLRLGEEEITVDSRPSDAIALALRVDAPVFVSEDVLDEAGAILAVVTDDDTVEVEIGEADAEAEVEVDEEAIEAEVAKFRSLLDDLDPAQLTGDESTESGESGEPAEPEDDDPDDPPPA
jgi:uncharacterized protein